MARYYGYYSTSQLQVFLKLLAKGKITQDMIALLDKWRHTGFNVFAGPRITLDKALD